VHCVGLLAAVPPATVQRLLGGRAGRQVADRARGIDPRPVTPRALPASESVSRTFPRHSRRAASAVAFRTRPQRKHTVGEFAAPVLDLQAGAVPLGDGSRGHQRG
jgi:hypothetical protein